MIGLISSTNDLKCYNELLYENTVGLQLVLITTDYYAIYDTIQKSNTTFKTSGLCSNSIYIKQRDHMKINYN